MCIDNDDANTLAALIVYGKRQPGPNGKRIHSVKANGIVVRTLDNPLNTWVRCLGTGKMVKRDNGRI